MTPEEEEISLITARAWDLMRDHVAKHGLGLDAHEFATAAEKAVHIATTFTRAIRKLPGGLL